MTDTNGIDPAAVFAWLESHGDEVPGPFKE
jgi:hypothetical protein